MCSRYVTIQDQIEVQLGDKLETFYSHPHSNIRAGDRGSVVILDHNGYASREMYWGWRFSWARRLVITAKRETLLRQPAFKHHLERRCLILMDGFFAHNNLLVKPAKTTSCVAGFWREEAEARAFVMLTKVSDLEAAPTPAPFILRPDQHAAWLGADWREVLSVA